MHPLLLWLLPLLALASSVPYCSFSGCADDKVCQCVGFFQFCDTQQQHDGLCTFTQSGIWLIVMLVLLLVVLLIILFVCLCCCCCCKYKRKKPTYVKLEPIKH
jgi:hypothetical protein